MNTQVLLDKLSEFLMVEQCGWQLYRIVGQRTGDPELKARYEEFGQETDHHRTILTGLIRDLGGDPDHVSPTARLAQAKSEALLGSALVSGPLGEAEREASELENVLLAETKDHADWDLLGQLAEQVPNGKGRKAIEAAVAEVGPKRTSTSDGHRPSWPNSASRRSPRNPRPTPNGSAWWSSNPTWRSSRSTRPRSTGAASRMEPNCRPHRRHRPREPRRSPEPPSGRLRPGRVPR